MAQSGGYLLAALGPLLVGTLHDLTGSWTASLCLLLALLVPQLTSGLAAGRARLAVPRLAARDRPPGVAASPHVAPPDRNPEQPRENA
jgi:CP family cyanate transporter-like MFS transporter